MKTPSQLQNDLQKLEFALKAQTKLQQDYKMCQKFIGIIAPIALISPIVALRFIPDTSPESFEIAFSVSLFGTMLASTQTLNHFIQRTWDLDRLGLSHTGLSPFNIQNQIYTTQRDAQLAAIWTEHGSMEPSDIGI